MKTQTASFPMIGILGLIFVTLKLCKVIDWSWWWVLSPWWITLGACAAAFLAVVIWAGYGEVKKISKSKG